MCVRECVCVCDLCVRDIYIVCVYESLSVCA